MSGPTQEELLAKAAFDEDGNTRVMEPMPSANTTPKRINLTDYNNKHNSARSKSRQGKKAGADAELAKASRDMLRDASAKTKGGKLPGTAVINAPLVRSTPGPDDAPTFSAAEKSATSSSENKNLVEEPTNQSNDPVAVTESVAEKKKREDREKKAKAEAEKREAEAKTETEKKSK